MVHQSLYLRYRPARFGEIIGQAHVVAALRNAVATDRVGHAYLFSGPRGTGKTSTARILAKALNCENLADGEPCGTCPSCTSITAGTSYELHELDAASNNKVDDIRELISRVAIGTPGRAKVYVLDEVHMLTQGAENALLKTLEEPPPHVVFVLCTTEAHKVAPTIRSRTQHLHFELLDADALEGHVRAVAADAGLVVSDADVAYVLAAGGGSARDTLSALDATAAAGRAPDGADVVSAVLEAVASSDTASALGAADAAARAGREPRILGEALLGRLRNAFLASVEAPLEHLPAAERAAAVELAGRLRPRALTFALELLGEALVAMREAPDPRVDLDLALVRLTKPDVGVTLQSLAERLERLERAARWVRPARRVAALRRARRVLAHRRARRPLAGSPPPPATPPRRARPRVVGPATGRGTRLLRSSRRRLDPPANRGRPNPRLRQPPRKRCRQRRHRIVTRQCWPGRRRSCRRCRRCPRASAPGSPLGRFLPNTPGALRLAFRTPGSLDGCAKYRSEVEAEFGRCFDRPVTVEFVLERDDHSTPDPPVVAAGGTATRSRYLGEVLAGTALPKARSVSQDRSGVTQVQQAFPGSRLVELEAT